MIVSITGLTRKVLLTGNPTKFVIAIAQSADFLQSGRKYQRKLVLRFSTYCSTNDSGDLFCFFKEKHGEFRKVQSLCIHEGLLTYNELLTFYNLCISQTLR